MSHPSPPPSDENPDVPVTPSAPMPPPIPPAPGPPVPPHDGPYTHTPYGAPPPYGQSPHGQPFGPPPYGAPYPPPATPAFGPPPGQPRGSSRGWWIGGIVVFVVLLLCCGCLGAGGYFIYRVMQDTEREAEDAVAAYLDDLRDGDYDDAYDKLCTDERDEETRAEFARRMETRPQLREFRVNDVGSTSDGDYTVEVELTYDNNETDTENITVIVDDDTDMKVCP